VFFNNQQCPNSPRDVDSEQSESLYANHHEIKPRNQQQPAAAALQQQQQEKESTQATSLPPPLEQDAKTDASVVTVPVYATIT
jgi:hypothetical protein